MSHTSAKRHRTRQRTKPQPPPTPPTPEENLIEARTRLEDALHALAAPRPQPDPDTGQIQWADSLYHQLAEAVPGQFLGRTGTQRSQPPMWVDAADLLTEIRKTVRRWHPDPCTHTAFHLGARAINVRLEPGHDLTLRRLGLLATYTWRPQDTPLLTRWANQIDNWAKRIETLFTEHHVKHLPAPCPACDTQIVYRQDTAGERVRQPALQIVTNPDGTYRGCQCQNCGHTWAPELFWHLARVLGYELPEGVLE